MKIATASDNVPRSLQEDPPPWFLDILRCPDCSSALALGARGLACRTCGYAAPGGRDLRPRHPSDLRLQCRREKVANPEEFLRTIDLTAPPATYSGPRALRDSTELMSEITARMPAGGDALDLGCGSRDQSAPLASLGFRYAGIDFDNAAADLLADAHCLPFAANSFDCVFSYAVLEHLHNPWVALSEVTRVLRPDGWLIGTVSQGEPFHSSYLHHTPWALVSLLQDMPELRLHRLWPSADTLAALATMGKYPRPLRALLGAADWLNAHLPWLAPRKMNWPLVDRRLDRLYRAASLCFAIQKQAQGSGGRLG